jgi:hypothetical protein
MNLNLVTTDNMPKSDIKNQVTNSTLLEQENSHTPITDENHEDKENAENVLWLKKQKMRVVMLI